MTVRDLIRLLQDRQAPQDRVEIVVRLGRVLGTIEDVSDTTREDVRQRHEATPEERRDARDRIVVLNVCAEDCVGELTSSGRFAFDATLPATKGEASDLIMRLVVNDPPIGPERPH